MHVTPGCLLLYLRFQERCLGGLTALGCVSQQPMGVGAVDSACCRWGPTVVPMSDKTARRRVERDTDPQPLFQTQLSRGPSFLSGCRQAEKRNRFP